MVLARDSLFSYILSFLGVWLSRIFLVFPFLFYLIIVILALDLCPHNTSQCTQVGFFFNKIFRYLSKKKKTKTWLLTDHKKAKYSKTKVRFYEGMGEAMPHFGMPTCKGIL